MQDRISFTKSIDCDDISLMIKDYFDEVMALYDLVGTYKNFNIKSNSDDTIDMIVFNLIFKTNEDSMQIFNMVNNAEIRKYHRTFKCDVQLNSNVLNITIKG